MLSSIPLAHHPVEVNGKSPPTRLYLTANRMKSHQIVLGYLGSANRSEAGSGTKWGRCRNLKSKVRTRLQAAQFHTVSYFAFFLRSSLRVRTNSLRVSKLEIERIADTAPSFSA